MQQWENIHVQVKNFLVIKVNGRWLKDTTFFERANEPLNDFLDRVGRAGWEVCGFAVQGNYREVLLKRPLDTSG